MFRTALLTSALALIAASPALAEAPHVMTDIAPVQSIVARVMQGVGEPGVILPPGASPHEHAMKPSEARALQQADLVFWVGEALTPWLEKPLASLASNAKAVELMAAEGTLVLPFRTDLAFGDADHDHDHEAEHAEAHGHTHEGQDPHIWLDPENAIVWTRLIATTLAQADPDNAANYAANAVQAEAELTALTGEITAEFAKVADVRFVTFHDAYQYFEHRFDVPAAGAISESDARAPSAARMAGIRDLVAAQHVHCIFAEPQFNSGLVDTVFAGSGIKLAVIDPLGTEFAPGAALYPELIRDIGQKMAACGA
tara:strand:+ start:485 stop:1423 length:939 start_codon:yes stop_codon:yes gene_type:complete